MDFVEGLSEGNGAIEVAVDGLGRVEVHNGRVRVTMTRVVERGGRKIEAPCLTVVWSIQAWLEAQAYYVRMRAHITAEATVDPGDDLVSIAVH